MSLVRSASPADLNDLIQLDFHSNPHPWGQSLISDALSSRYNLVIEDHESGAIVGWLTASVLLDQSELELILVDQTLRRQGIARQLLNNWLDSMKSNSVVSFILEVRQSNLAAQRLYEQFGFQMSGVRKGYYSDATGREDALLMNLNLTEGNHHG